MINNWVTHYYNWKSQDGGTKVKPLRFIGLRSKSNYVYKYEHENTTYCAELYECITETGFKKICAFYVPYNEVYIKQLKSYGRTKKEEPIDDLNYLTDSLETYYTKRLTPNKLLIKKQTELNTIIENVLKEFKNTTNFEDPEYKMGLQIYIQRLQTPCILTRKEWKKFQHKHPYLTEKIINTSRQHLVMN